MFNYVNNCTEREMMISIEEMSKSLGNIYLDMNITQDDLADKIGITRVTLWKILKLRGTFSFKTMLKVERFIVNYNKDKQ